MNRFIHLLEVDTQETEAIFSSLFFFVFIHDFFLHPLYVCTTIAEEPDFYFLFCQQLTFSLSRYERDFSIRIFSLEKKTRIYDALYSSLMNNEKKKKTHTFRLFPEGGQSKARGKPCVSPREK